MDIRYQILFEEFQQKLIQDRDLKLNKNNCKGLFDEMTEEEKAFFKITKKGPIEPKIIQIMEPAEEQMLLKKPDGHLIATNAAFKFMKLLVDEYKKDEAKLEEKLVTKLKATFTKALRTGDDNLMDGVR
jgi:hypothetical protein